MPPTDNFLPPLLVLTDRRQSEAAGRTLIETMMSAIEGGARAVVLREKDLPTEQRIGLAAILAGVLHEVQGRLIVASDAQLALRAGADGVHLANADPWPDPTALPEGFFVGRSCHSRADVGEATGVGADYATLSPMFTTESKPGYGPPLGPDDLMNLALPTFALGGVTAERAPYCLAAGAFGVACMGEVMRSDDPRIAVARLIEALDVVVERVDE